MPSILKLASFSLLAFIGSASASHQSAAHAILRRAEDQLGQDIPATCIKPCDSFVNATLACIGNSSLDALAEDPMKMYACACNSEFGGFVGTCVSCMFANADAAAIEDASYTNETISEFNLGCTAYATNVSKTWTNTTLTATGGLEDKKSGAGSLAAGSFGAAFGLVGMGIALLA